MHPDSPYQVVCKSRVLGEFRGYQGGRVYRLENGEVWQQERNKFEFVYRENPGCLILSIGFDCFLDVEGTSTMVRIRRVQL